MDYRDFIWIIFIGLSGTACVIKCIEMSSQLEKADYKYGIQLQAVFD